MRSPRTQAPPQTSGSEEERHDGKLVLADAGGGNVDGKHPDDGGGGQPQPGSRLSGIEGQEEEGDRRAERRAERVAESVQDGAGGGCESEYGERRSAPGGEREGGERGQDDPERIEVARVVGGPRRRRGARARERTRLRRCLRRREAPCDSRFEGNGRSRPNESPSRGIPLPPREDAEVGHRGR